MKFDFDKMSVPRKIALTCCGLLYGLAILGNARHGFSIILGVTLFFLAVTSVLLLWVK